MHMPIPFVNQPILLPIPVSHFVCSLHFNWSKCLRAPVTGWYMWLALWCSNTCYTGMSVASCAADCAKWLDARVLYECWQCNRCGRIFGLSWWNIFETLFKSTLETLVVYAGPYGVGCSSFVATGDVAVGIGLGCIRITLTGICVATQLGV